MTTHQRNSKINYTVVQEFLGASIGSHVHTPIPVVHTVMRTQQAEADGATPPAWEPCTGNQHSKNRPRSSALPSTDTRVQESVHRYSGPADGLALPGNRPRAGISGQLCCLRGRSSNLKIHDP